MILDHSALKLSSLLQRFSIDQSDSVYITIDHADIKGCYKTQCIKSNLYEFISTLNKYVPYFILYKIEINKQLLYQSTMIPNFVLEEESYINNHNQLLIALSIDAKYWMQVI